MEAAAPNSGDHNRRRLRWTEHFPKTGFSERVPILGLCRTSASRTSSSAARSRAANHLRPGDTCGAGPLGDRCLLPSAREIQAHPG